MNFIVAIFVKIKARADQKDLFRFTTFGANMNFFSFSGFLCLTKNYRIPYTVPGTVPVPLFCVLLRTTVYRCTSFQRFRLGICYGYLVRLFWKNLCTILLYLQWCHVEIARARATGGELKFRCLFRATLSVELFKFVFLLSRILLRKNGNNAKIRRRYRANLKHFFLHI